MQTLIGNTDLLNACITTPKIADANVTARKLHPTLDLSSGFTLYLGSLSSAIVPSQPSGTAQAVVHIYAGNGAPSNADGINGDFYFRGNGGVGTFIYHKAAGSWTGIA